MSAPLIQSLLSHLPRFAEEEGVLTAAQYPLLVKHKNEHAGLLRRAEQLLQAMKEQRAGISEVIGFLAFDMVQNHMLVSDRHYFEWLVRRGLSQAPPKRRPGTDGLPLRRPPTARDPHPLLL